METALNPFHLKDLGPIQLRSFEFGRNPQREQINSKKKSPPVSAETWVRSLDTEHQLDFEPKQTTCEVGPPRFPHMALRTKLTVLRPGGA